MISPSSNRKLAREESELNNYRAATESEEQTWIYGIVTQQNANFH